MSLTVFLPPANLVAFGRSFADPFQLDDERRSGGGRDHAVTVGGQGLFQLRATVVQRTFALGRLYDDVVCDKRQTR